MSHFLTPVLALIIWTLIMWGVMYARRIPAMKAIKIDPDSAKSPDGDWKEIMPAKAQYAAHNYNHLMEQPTIFYALMFYIALTGGESGLMGALAWAYVVLRVIHSLIQISSNKVMVRFAIFTLSTIMLIVMASGQVIKLF